MQGLEKQDGQWCRVEITPDALNPTDDMEWVSEPCCGAICSFVGITRDTFEGRKVVTLEYEAYKDMAEHTLRALCQTGKQRWEIEKMSVRHRIGRVDVGEASVVIVVSSKHRKEGLEVSVGCILFQLL